jgi:cellulose synthase/poly-beta-1,6-N-acetylglucosamine synthase-like glycosyltransferase/peptidoglycan/xylan/chitin deacetylase (PgdA/CDA1 family)
MAEKPVFFDASGRRAASVTVVGWTAAIVSGLLAAAFLASLILIDTKVPGLIMPGRLTAIHIPELEKKAQDPELLKLAARLAVEARQRREEIARAHRLRAERGGVQRALAAILKPQQGRPLSIGFYPNWGNRDQRQAALDALKHALPHLDWVVPTWLNLQGPNLDLKPAYDSFDDRMFNYVRRTKPGLAIVPSLQNVELGKWDGPGLARLLADAKHRTALVKGLTDFVGKRKLQGVTVDFEQVPDSAHSDLGLFLKELAASFMPRGWVVVIAVPLDDDSWPFAQYAPFVDYTLLMAYDEHEESSGPGSIAGQSWFEETLDKRMKVLNPSHTLVALGAFAYDWNGGQTDNLSFQEATIAAHDSEAAVTFDDATNNPHFSYVEDNQIRHDIWFLDGVTAYNEIHAADGYQPAGYALWRLGSEDPTVWSVMGRPYGTLPPDGLRNIPIGRDIDFEGQGEIFRVEASPVDGARSIEVNRMTGDIDDETYTKLPSTFVIRQFGYAPKKIALTFDDGPDPRWTTEILDILKAKNVKATFFIVGANAEANPAIVQRIIAEGHEVGNHTFTHPNLAETPIEAVKLELAATQRLFEALTGRSLRFFRPPYLGDAEPTDEDEIVPVQVAQDLGYTTIGEHVDPNDWALPGVDAIVQRSLAQVHNPNPELHGNVILLHDAGGSDRSQTVAALPVLIDRLKAEGYQFVLVSNLAGLTRDQSMPPLTPTLSLYADRVVFLMLGTLGRALYFCFLAAIWLGISRLIFLAILSVWNRPRELGEQAPPPTEQPYRVSVVIPAYNEEKVIRTTISRILASSYTNLNVIVVDDGSRDETSRVVREAFGENDSVTLIRIANGGKANALNVGLQKAEGEIIVALDADTQFNIDTIARLVRWFSDPEVGAVAGNAKVGNRINMITRWQALEYIVAQNLERRALAALGTLTVVPGAVGAWRRRALVAVGGFKGDTVAEDQELTINLQKHGYHVNFDSSAIAWTEAPTTFSGLAKQRFRWAYGTLQCLWKYRDLTFNPRAGTLGFIALPQVWLFQIVLATLAPLADLLLIWQLFWQWIAYAQHGAEFDNADLVTVGVYYIVFVIVDLAAAVFGFLMEKNERWSLLFWLVLQRFGYRQLMYYVVVRSISAAIRGPFVGWGKLERTGTVKVQA